MKPDFDRPFRIGKVAVYPKRNEIALDGRIQAVEPKVMDVLLCLVSAEGEVVSRRDILDQVWSDVVVGEQVLTRAISELRKAFDDDPGDPAYIATVIKGGYRLVAPIGPVYEPAPVMRSKRWGARAVWLAGAVVIVLVVAQTVAIVGGDEEPGSVLIAGASPVTTHPALEYDPALSPDGGRVAYVWNGLDAESWDIYVTVVGSSAPMRLTTERGSDGSPTWSPDGRFIAYYRYDGSCGLYLRPAMGGPERNLAECRAMYPTLSWGPSGAGIVFNERAIEGGPYRLVLLDPDTGEKHVLTDPPDHIVGDGQAVFSPAGTRIAFVRTVSEGLQDIFMLDTEGVEVRRLTHAGRNVYGIDWTADGETLVFSSSRDGLSALWRLDVATGRLERLSSNDRAGNPTIRGDRLIYERWSSRVNIWRADVLDRGLGDLRPVISSTLWDLHPAVSADGRRLAFSSNRSGSYELWMQDVGAAAPGKGAASRVTQFDQRFVSDPDFSPTGDRLVFTARPESQADIFVVPVPGGRPRQITESSADDLAPAFSADGESIYFASSRGGSWNIWRVELVGGGDPELVIPGGYAAQENPAGTVLYFTRPDTPGLWKVTRGQTDTTLVTSDLSLTDHGTWAVTEAGIYTVKRTSSPRTDSLMLINAGGVSRGIGRFPHPVPSGDAALAATPDGRIVFVGQREWHNADLMMIEDFE